MAKQTFANLVTNTRKTLSKHSSTILVGTGIAGWTVTTILAVRATPKALELIAEKKEKDDVEKLTPMETVKVTWKCYLPPVILGITSTACLIGSNSINTRRNAALATAYKLSETAFTEYRENVIKTIGDKKEADVRENIAKSRVEKQPVTSSEIIITGKGKTLMMEPISGRYFESDIETVKRAQNELNKQMLNHMYVSLNEFFDELDLSHTRIGDDIGWNIEKGFIYIHFSAVLTEDERPAIVMSYAVEPTYGFSTFE